MECRSIAFVNLPIDLEFNGFENLFVLIFSDQPPHLPSRRRLLFGNDGEFHLAFFPVDLAGAGNAPCPPFSLDDIVRCHFMRVFINGGSAEVFLIEDLSDGPQDKLLLGLVYIAGLIRFADGNAFHCAGPKEQAAERDQNQGEERERSGTSFRFGMAGVTSAVKGLIVHGGTIISSSRRVKRRLNGEMHIRTALFMEAWGDQKTGHCATSVRGRGGSPGPSPPRLQTLQEAPCR